MSLGRFQVEVLLLLLTTIIIMFLLLLFMDALKFKVRSKQFYGLTGWDSICGTAVAKRTLVIITTRGQHLPFNSLDAYARSSVFLLLHKNLFFCSVFCFYTHGKQTHTYRWILRDFQNKTQFLHTLLLDLKSPKQQNLLSHSTKQRL